MSNTKSVTIQIKHLHPTIREAILAAESRSGEAVRLLNELVQLRLDRASTDALAEETAEQSVTDQVRALKLDLAGAQTQLNKRDRQIEALTQSLHTRKEELALKVKKRDEDRVETRAALDHAIELIVYFKGKAEDY